MCIPLKRYVVWVIISFVISVSYLFLKGEHKSLYNIESFNLQYYWFFSTASIQQHEFVVSLLY